MYSVVLLMALSGPQAPDGLLHRHNSCGGGGYAVASCSGGYGCNGGGYAVSSCSGGRHHHHRGGRMFGHHHHRGHSCCGGGYANCSGGWGGGYANCSGGYGNGYMGCSGGYWMGDGSMMAPPPPPKKGEKLPPPKEKKDGKKKGEVSAPATIVVSLPADATVAIDGVATTSTSATRTFVTPELNPAKDFVYVLSAEIVRDGQKLSARETVSVRAGQETRVNFAAGQFLSTTVAAK